MMECRPVREFMGIFMANMTASKGKSQGKWEIYFLIGFRV